MREFDFCLSWSVRAKECFIYAVMGACKKKNLSFLWCCNNNVSDVVKQVNNNEFKIRFLLDTEATYNKERDRYAQLCYSVKDAGGVVVNDPDRIRLAIDKSVMHYELINSGINTPYSVVVRNWEPNSFHLTVEEKEKLGIPFVIKPACGYARLGVVEDARGSIRQIAQARNFDRGDNFLLQEKINPIELGGKRAWFRVFHLFDKIIPCWWDDCSCAYEHLTYEEFKKYNLSPLVKIVSKIAAITQIQWFSTEIAIDNKFGKMRFVAIDYVNDQCDMTPQSENKRGVPDSIVEFTASYIVESAYRLINKKDTDKTYSVWFKDASGVQIRGLPDAPEPLKYIE